MATLSLPRHKPLNLKTARFVPTTADCLGIKYQLSCLAQRLTPEESDNLPDSDVLAQEIVEDLEAALEHFTKSL